MMIWYGGDADTQQEEPVCWKGVGRLPPHVVWYLPTTPRTENTQLRLFIDYQINRITFIW
jgi:hypothetical protein